METFVQYMSEIVKFMNEPGIKAASIVGIVVVVGTYLANVGVKETCRRIRENKVRLILFFSVLFAAFILVFLPAGLNIQKAGDYEAMKPLDWKTYKVYDERNEEVTLNFAEKERISLGFLGFHGKYGFRKELVVKEPVAFAQGMPTDFDMEHIRFGIYRDPELTDPIDEADAGYNFNADWHIEEGAEYSDYPDYKTNIFAILQPGTYYTAVYSTFPYDDKVVLYYSSWYDVLESDLTLKEGKPKCFYAFSDETYEFPFTVDDDTEIILETSGIAGTLTLLDRDHETVLDTRNIKVKKKKADREIHFTFEHGGTYYFVLTDYAEEFTESERRYGWGELHRNWLRYTIAK